MRLLRGACPERHEILPLPLKGQNDTKRMARNDIPYRLCEAHSAEAISEGEIKKEGRSPFKKLSSLSPS